MKKTKTKAFWKQFLNETKLPKTTECEDVFAFGWTPEIARKLAELVRSGQKKATTSCLRAFEIEKAPLPEVGRYSIITDFEGNPYSVIRNTKITVLPYREVTFEICSREGEDECLETWQKNHWDSFVREGQELGYEFTKDTKVVFQDFEAVYPKSGNNQ